MLLISHDRAFLDNVTNRTVELSLGKVTDYKVSYSKYVVLRAERRAQQMAAYENQQRMIEKTEEFIEKFRYKPTKSNQVLVKAQVAANASRLAELEALESQYNERILKIMMTIPNIIDPSVPIGKDDSENVEIEKFGEPLVPDFEIPYHTDIMKTFDGIDLDAAGKVAGNGFYYLMGDIARLHSSVILSLIHICQEIPARKAVTQYPRGRLSARMWKQELR